jgi:hypothetical protein
MKVFPWSGRERAVEAASKKRAMILRQGKVRRFG